MNRKFKSKNNNKKQKSPKELEEERNLAKKVLNVNEEPNAFEREIIANLSGMMQDTYENRIQVVEAMMTRLNIPHKDITTRRSNRLQKKKAEVDLDDLPLLEMRRLTVDTGPVQQQENEQQVNAKETMGLGEETEETEPAGAAGGNEVLKVRFDDE